MTGVIEQKIQVHGQIEQRMQEHGMIEEKKALRGAKEIVLHHLLAQALVRLCLAAHRAAVAHPV